MGANLKKTFVVDIEATCWREGEQADGPMEVIEIGIVAMSLRDGSILQRQSYPVRPQLSSVSDFCTELTGWTSEKLENAPTIQEVLPRIRDEFGLSKNMTWWSCGESDRRKLSGDPRLTGSLGYLYRDLGALFEQGTDPSAFSLMRGHYNIKTLMAMKYGWDRERGMARMLQSLGLPLKGQHHSGVDDAENTAQLVWHFLRHSQV
jgi:inhibitor of KinA sporulation pathway (predicted exonuclease)